MKVKVVGSYGSKRKIEGRAEYSLLRVDMPLEEMKAFLARLERRTNPEPSTLHLIRDVKFWIAKKFPAEVKPVVKVVKRVTDTLIERGYKVSEQGC